MITEDQLKALQKIADANNGHCDRCGRVIKIYRYKINGSFVSILRAMAAATNETRQRSVDLNSLDLPYSVLTQRTKMRLHGLIQNTDDKQSHWLITRKGWNFLRGEKVPARVVVFDNQNLGYMPEYTTIHRIARDDIVYEDETITPAEAQAYHDVRTARVGVKYMARYKGSTLSGVYKDTVYEVHMNKIEIAKPIKLTSPITYEYPSIAWFQKDWEIITQVKEND